MYITYISDDIYLYTWYINKKLAIFLLKKLQCYSNQNLQSKEDLSMIYLIRKYIIHIRYISYVSDILDISIKKLQCYLNQNIQPNKIYSDIPDMNYNSYI